MRFSEWNTARVNWGRRPQKDRFIQVVSDGEMPEVLGALMGHDGATIRGSSIQILHSQKILMGFPDAQIEESVALVLEYPVECRNELVDRFVIENHGVPAHIPPYADCDHDMVKDAYRFRWARLAVSLAEYETVFDLEDFAPADEPELPTFTGLMGRAMGDLSTTVAGVTAAAIDTTKAITRFAELTRPGPRASFVSELVTPEHDPGWRPTMRLGYGLMHTSKNSIVKLDTTC